MDGNLSEFELELACLLFAYDADAPHFSQPGLDCGSESEQFYKYISKDEFVKILSDDHTEGCDLPYVYCQRCYVEQIAHQAKWMASKL